MSTECHLNAGSSPVHPPGTQQSDLPEANPLAEGDEHNAVPGPSYHLDCSRGDDEHLHPHIAFLSKYWQKSYNETIIVQLFLALS